MGCLHAVFSAGLQSTRCTVPCFVWLGTSQHLKRAMCSRAEKCETGWPVFFETRWPALSQLQENQSLEA